MEFICALVQVRGVLPETARKYFSAVQGWHAREFGIKIAGGLKLERLPQMVKGLRRIGAPRVPRPDRRGITPAQLQRALSRLDPKDKLHANVRAAFATALQGLLRSAEYCGTDGKLRLDRGDVRRLDSTMLELLMHPCKNVNSIGLKDVPLIIGAGGAHVDAVAEMRNLFAVDPAPADAPLFRDPSTNKPLSYVPLHAAD